MFTKSIALTLSSLLLFNTAFAQDCLPDLSKSLPDIKLPDLNLEASPNSYFCFDRISEKDSDSINKFETLNMKNVFDENGCVIDKGYDPETSAAITDLIVQTTRGHLNVYAADPLNPSAKSVLVMTNSSNNAFINKAVATSQFKVDNPNKLTTKDAVEIGGAAVIGSLVGVVVERQAFKGEHDKLLHANYGAMINIGSVGAAYLAVETSGLGDKLKLSKNQKKWVILLTGTVMGLLVGYGKERFYDYNHRDTHTYDPHFKGDMGATWLGGGALNVLGGAITFQF